MEFTKVWAEVGVMEHMWLEPIMTCNYADYTTVYTLWRSPKFLGTFCTLAGAWLQSRLVKEYVHLYPNEALQWTRNYVTKKTDK